MKRIIFIVLILVTIQSKGYTQVVSFDIDSSRFQMELLPILDSIYTKDQSLRLKWVELMEQKVSEKEIDSMRHIIQETDKENLTEVEKILTRYGWLGPQDVGFNGSQALFLVIQHADLETQQKYLPMVREAEVEGKILSSNVAILEDRVAIREGRKQLYGSQGFRDKETGKTYIYPTIFPDSLDIRRKSKGLPPMKEYVKDWDLEKYKQMLPEIERMANKKE